MIYVQCKKIQNDKKKNAVMSGVLAIFILLIAAAFDQDQTGEPHRLITTGSAGEFGG